VVFSNDFVVASTLRCLSHAVHNQRVVLFEIRCGRNLALFHHLPGKGSGKLLHRHDLAVLNRKECRIQRHIADIAAGNKKLSDGK
jgi:hypothetical protein